jgi:hypothetical protein
MTTETEVKQEENPSADSVVRERTSDVGTKLWHLTERIARWTGRQLSRSRVRTFVVGVALILVVALFVGHSFWTAPLVIIGVLMIIVAWVGSRLEGRFAIEWSEFGTGFEMHARFKSSNVPAPQLDSAPAPVSGPKLGQGHAQAEEDDHDVIDGEAHTMEIPVEELRALVAALEQVTPLAHRGGDGAELTHSSNSTSTRASANRNGSDRVESEIADEQ